MTKPPSDADEKRRRRSWLCRVWERVAANDPLRLIEIFLLIIGAALLARQIDVAREAEKRGLRAYVSVKPADIRLTEDRVATIPIAIVNSGQTPAYRVYFSARAFDELADEALKWRWNFDSKNTFSRRIGALSGSTARDIPMDSPINTSMGGREGRQFYVVGVVYYDDVYNRPHWTSFCLVWPSKDLTANGGAFCDRYNETDETMPDLPKKGPLTVLPTN